MEIKNLLVINIRNDIICIMKISIIVLTLILLSACTTIAERNFIASQQLNNIPLEKLIEVFGFPDDEREVLEKQVFIWNKAGWIGSYNTDDNTTNYSQGNCRLKVIVNKNKNVENATLDGMTCKKLRKQINKRLANPTSQYL